MLTLASRYGGFAIGKSIFNWFGGSGFNAVQSNSRLTVTASQIISPISPGGNAVYWQVGSPSLSEAKTTGKWYWEMELNNNGGTGPSGYPFVMCGIGLSTSVPTPYSDGSYFGSAYSGISLITGTGVQYINSTLYGSNLVPISGSRIGFAVDIDKGHVWVRGGGQPDWWDNLNPDGSPWAAYTPNMPTFPQAAAVGDGVSLTGSVQYFYNSGSLGLP